MHVVLTILLFSRLMIPAIEDIEINMDDQQYIEKQRVQKKVSIIIEVEGDPEIHKKYIEKYYPSIEVVMTYHKLFQGLALKGKPEKMRKLSNLYFVKGVYPVQTYTSLTDSVQNFQEDFAHPNITFPSHINQTSYTGKGIKVAVIDTGIDLTHQDLRTNYRGGYDLVDLDEEPMETTIDEGMPTAHGTHVAGIIAANGDVKGVAPDASIYAFRALGPGGVGTSIQVIAAMEEAVKVGVDVMNLSLGNTVNGPDYPTSKAVNEASKLGVAVVIANGNDGPASWTVGAPATASTALSVGAYEDAGIIPILYEPSNKVKIKLYPYKYTPFWNLSRDYNITHLQDNKPTKEKIVLMKQKNKAILKDLLHVQNSGAVAVIIQQDNVKDRKWEEGLQEADIRIPVAFISKEDGDWINQTNNGELYFKSITEYTKPTIAKFSSRGPVTVNWMMKPDVVAPGVNIVSTVPGGYDVLNGTSMAAPHVAGAVAVIKEARPNWSNEQIFGAIKTTADRIHTYNNKPINPNIQGMGLINIEKAIQTETIIDDPLLAFGKVKRHVNSQRIYVTIQNVSNRKQKYYFTIPNKQKGLTWYLPQSFAVNPKEKLEVPITLKINSLQLNKGTYQGWLSLHNEDNTFFLPYLFINETADYPKVMGFSFHINRMDQSVYKYQLYVAEQIKSVQVQLFDPQSLVFEGTLIKRDDLEVGLNEGEIKRRDIVKRGYFYGLIVVQLQNGEYVNYDTEVYIE